VVYDAEKVSTEDHMEFTAIAITDDIGSHHVSLQKYDADLVSYDNKYRLDMSSNAPIIPSEGGRYEGDYADKKLLVFHNDAYGTNDTIRPKKVVVFDDKMAKNMQDMIKASKKGTADLGPEIFMDSLSDTDINRLKRAETISDVVVNFRPLAIEKPFKADNGTMMVSLSEIARELDMRVKYNRNTRMVGIGNDFTFLVGHPSVTIDGKMILLSAAPIEKHGKIYVPVDFFNKVLNKTTFVEGGKIIIND